MAFEREQFNVARKIPLSSSASFERVIASCGIVPRKNNFTVKFIKSVALKGSPNNALPDFKLNDKCLKLLPPFVIYIIYKIEQKVKYLV